MRDPLTISLENSIYECDSFMKFMSLASVFAAHLIFLLIIPSAQVFGHAGEVSSRNILSDGSEMTTHGENELVILSRFIPGDIVLSADPKLGQWDESFENNVRSPWGHNISIRTLNNGTHIFFLLSWHDSTIVPPMKNLGAKDKVLETAAAAIDGSAIIFERPIERALDQEKSNSGIEGEPREELKDTWQWSTNSSTTAGIITRAEEHNGNWNVVIGRDIQHKNDNGNSISFQTGVREENFIKFLVWDGSRGESFTKVNDETLPHYDFILLPEINIYPKDVYIWSGVLAAGAVLFLFVEQRLYQGVGIKEQNGNLSVGKNGNE